MHEQDDETVERWGQEAHAQGVPRDGALLAGKWLEPWQRGWDKAQGIRRAEQAGAADRRRSMMGPCPFPQGEQADAWQRSWLAESEKMMAERAGDPSDKQAISGEVTRARESEAAASRAIDRLMPIRMIGDAADRARLVRLFFAGAEWATGQGQIDAVAEREKALRGAIDSAVAIIGNLADIIWAFDESDRSEQDGDWRADQERFVSAALDAGVDQISEADEPPLRVLPDLGPHGDEEPPKVQPVNVLCPDGFKASVQDEADGSVTVSFDRSNVEPLRRAPPNLRPVTDGPLADPSAGEAIEALLGAAIDTPPVVLPLHRPEGAADLTVFRINTADPGFKPDQPVVVNGYLYKPATQTEGTEQ